MFRRSTCKFFADTTHVKVRIFVRDQALFLSDILPPAGKPLHDMSRTTPSHSAVPCRANGHRSALLGARQVVARRL